MLQYYSGREGRVSSITKFVGVREDGSVDWGQQVKNGIALSNPITALLQTSKIFFTGWKEESEWKDNQEIALVLIILLSYQPMPDTKLTG